jgi:hypothetical protein
VNKPHTFKAIVITALVVSKDYMLKVVMQSSARGSSGLLKGLWEIHPDFKLTAHSVQA